jgi:DNA-binding transcriptional ArsR family regulator
MPSAATVDDPIRLRALAHPLRMRLLGLLRLDGPSTASGLAARLGESSGSTSYHLRQLARHGFIERAEELDRGRERWWRASDEATIFRAGDIADSPEGAVLSAAYQRQVLQTHTAVAAQYLDELETWESEWTNTAGLSDSWVRLTPDRLAALTKEIMRLIAAAEVADDDEDAADAERVAAMVHAIPVRELRL